MDTIKVSIGYGFHEFEPEVRKAFGEAFGPSSGEALSHNEAAALKAKAELAASKIKHMNAESRADRAEFKVRTLGFEIARLKAELADNQRQYDEEETRYLTQMSYLEDKLQSLAGSLFDAEEVIDIVKRVRRSVTILQASPIRKRSASRGTASSIRKTKTRPFARATATSPAITAFPVIAVGLVPVGRRHNHLL